MEADFLGSIKKSILYKESLQAAAAALLLFSWLRLLTVLTVLRLLPECLGELGVDLGSCCCWLLLCCCCRVSCLTGDDDTDEFDLAGAAVVDVVEVVVEVVAGRQGAAGTFSLYSYRTQMDPFSPIR